MIEKLLEIAESNRERTVYIYKDEKLTFGELIDRAQKIAAGFDKEDKSPVAVIGGKNHAVIETITACLIAKRAFVPINLSVPEERKNRIITASKAGMIADCKDDAPVFTKTQNGAQNDFPEDMAYIIFTSGSTGEPKGVPISRRNLDNFIRWITSLEPICGFEHAFVLNQAEFSFDLSTVSLCSMLFDGNTLVQMDMNGDYSAVFDTILKNKTEIFVTTPTFMRLCVLNKDFCEKNFPFVKCIYFCGETLQKSLVKTLFERFPDIKIINAYGPTEATSAVCAIEITKEVLEHEETLPVGEIKIAATEIVIEDGEIVLKGKSVFGGYLDKTSGGHYIKDKTHCYRTGDMGFIKDGKLYFSGRKDSQIKYKGYRIELSDIEANMCSIEGIENCAVITKKNPAGEVMLIKTFASGKITEGEIRDKLSRKLPEYMIPKIIKILDSLPVNQNGKIDRKKLETL